MSSSRMKMKKKQSTLEEEAGKRPLRVKEASL